MGAECCDHGGDHGGDHGHHTPEQVLAQTAEKVAGKLDDIVIGKPDCCDCTGLTIAIGVGMLLFFVANYLLKRRTFSLKGKHVCITGGSQGIGLELAILAVRKMAAGVTIIARKQEHLDNAKGLLTALSASVKIQTISADVSDQSKIEEALSKAAKEFGAIDVLVCNAGYCQPAEVEHANPGDWEKMMKVNYLGAAYATRHCFADMKPRGEGAIVLVSSQAGQTGVYGLSGYTATKFALRGFAEALDVEAQPLGVSVSVAFPPDTETPGYAAENESKPKLTKDMCDVAGLWAPDIVARGIWDGACAGKHHIYFGVDGTMLALLTGGMAPVQNMFEGLATVLLIPIFKLVSMGYSWYFRNMVLRAAKASESRSKASEKKDN